MGDGEEGSDSDADSEVTTLQYLLRYVNPLIHIRTFSKAAYAAAAAAPPPALAHGPPRRCDNFSCLYHSYQTNNPRLGENFKGNIRSCPKCASPTVEALLRLGAHP